MFRVYTRFTDQFGVLLRSFFLCRFLAVILLLFVGFVSLFVATFCSLRPFFPEHCKSSLNFGRSFGVGYYSRVWGCSFKALCGLLWGSLTGIGTFSEIMVPAFQLMPRSFLLGTVRVASVWEIPKRKSFNELRCPIYEPLFGRLLKCQDTFCKCFFIDRHN